MLAEPADHLMCIVASRLSPNRWYTGRTGLGSWISWGDNPYSIKPLLQPLPLSGDGITLTLYNNPYQGVENYRQQANSQFWTLKCGKQEKCVCVTQILTLAPVWWLDYWLRASPKQQVLTANQERPYTTEHLQRSCGVHASMCCSCPGGRRGTYTILEF